MKLLKKILFIFAICIFGTHLFIFGGILFYRAFYPQETVFMRWRMIDAQKNVSLQYHPVAYDKISAHLKQALIASEDANFSEHDGFDWKGIQNALRKNRRSGKIRAGGSTITQQLAKNLWLTPNRNMLRKGEEAIITAMLESAVSKDRIFDLYLNVIEWGEGIYGAQAASQYYYKKSADKLSATEAADLASMVTRPVFYQEHRNSGALQKKSNIIRRRMKNAQIPE